MIVYGVVGWMTFIIVVLFLIVVFLASKAKIGNLEKRNRDLIEQKSKLSDQVRIKGIAVDRLTRKIKRLEKGENGRIHE